MSKTRSVTDRVRMTALSKPHRPALTYMDSTGTMRTWTYERLQHAVERTQRRLAVCNPEACTVAVVMSSDAESVATLLALEKTAHLAILLPQTLSPEELAQTMVVSGARWQVTSGRIAEQTLSSVHAAPDPITGFIGQLTSGSAGRPRLAVRTHAAVRTEIEAVSAALALSRGAQANVLVGSSIAHSYGLIGGVLATLWQGDHVLVARDHASFTRMWIERRPTVVFGLTSLYGALLDANRETVLAKPHWAFSAGAPLCQELFSAFLQRHDCALRQDYGTTETGTISLNLDLDPITSCAGRPLSHLELQLKCPAEAELEPGMQGELRVRSPAVAVRYLLAQGSAAVTNSEGWYRTRDAASLDGNGNLWLGRRLRDRVLTTGGPVSLDDVERAISLMPGVLESVVIPAQTSASPGDLHAIVVGAGLEDQAVIRWCRQVIPHHAVPATVEIREHLSRSPAGKVLHKYLELSTGAPEAPA